MEQWASENKKITENIIQKLHALVMALRKLDPRRRKALEIFIESAIITSSQLGKLFGFAPRTATKLCAQWVENGFLEIVDPSNKARKYRLSHQYEKIINANLDRRYS